VAVKLDIQEMGTGKAWMSFLTPPLNVAKHCISGHLWIEARHVARITVEKNT
jgi:hypothetical protein